MSPRRWRQGSVVARTLLVLFFCAGIVVLGLLAGGEHPPARARLGRDPMAGYFPVGMPRYPSVVELPAGEQSFVGASRMRLSYFSTADEPDRVARFYGERWQAQGFFVREEITHRGGVVSAIDEKERRVYQVLIATDGDQTTVFPSVTDAPTAAMQAPADPPPVPLFPESRTLIHLGSEERDARARVVLSVNDGGLEANEAYYRQALAGAGYREELRQDKPPLPQQRLLVFRRAGSEVTINLTSLGGKRVRVHLMVVES